MPARPEVEVNRVMEPSVSRDARSIRNATARRRLPAVCVLLAVATSPGAADDCGDAMRVGVNTVVPFDTTGASASGVEIDPGICAGSFFTGIGSDLWFRLSLPSAGTLRLSTCDPAGFDTDLSLHRGDCRMLETIACNGDVPADPSCQPRHSEIEAVVSEPAEHLVRVGGFNGRTGSGSLVIDFDPACLGDLDGDGRVGGGDLGLLFQQWGDCPGCEGDLDGDGMVRGSDLGLMFQRWGPCE